MLPPPTTSTVPVGRSSGERYWVLCSCTTSRPEAGGYRRRERHLKRPGGDHDLVGLVGAVGELDEEAAAVASPDRLHAAVELDRELELAARSR